MKMPKRPLNGHPLWRFDRERLRAVGCAELVGVDEAGRGALAGPVVAAAAWIPEATYANKTFHRDSRAINDSKQLKASERAAQFALIEDWQARSWVRVCWSAGSVEEIAALNILGATVAAMMRSAESLAVRLPVPGADDALFAEEASAAPVHILIDGKPLKKFRWRHEAVVGGDGKSLAIAMASIVAKVARDRLMVALQAEDPRYGYDQHKGYGAPQHLVALREHGPSKHHREKFLRKLSLRDGVPWQRGLF